MEIIQSHRTKLADVYKVVKTDNVIIKYKLLCQSLGPFFLQNKYFHFLYFKYI